MVTIDKIVENVGKFNGDMTSHRNYERAKENVEVLTKDIGMTKLEETLKKQTGYDDFNWPSEPENYSITLGDVTFNVKSEMTTKRPQYKTAVMQMENYINGIRLLLASGKAITGVAKDSKQNKWCISVDALLEQYELIIAGVKSPGIKQTIKYETSGIMDIEDVPKELHLAIEDTGDLTADNFRNYVRKDKLLDVSSKYVKAFEKKLGSAQKINGVVALNTRKGYKEETTKSEGTNWAYVVKTLVIGDLFVNLGWGLADADISFREKKRDMPYFDLFIRNPSGKKTVYIGLDSVYHRIQDLKNEEKISAAKTKYVAKEIV